MTRDQMAAHMALHGWEAYQTLPSEYDAQSYLIGNEALNRVAYIDKLGATSIRLTNTFVCTDLTGAYEPCTWSKLPDSMVQAFFQYTGRLKNEQHAHILSGAYETDSMSGGR